MESVWGEAPTLPEAALLPRGEHAGGVWRLLELPPGLAQRGTFPGHAGTRKRGCSPFEGPVWLLGSSW